MEESASDPHSLEYKGFTTIKKKKVLSALARESILTQRQPLLSPLPVPFHIKFIEEILVPRNECMGLFTVGDFIKLSHTCKKIYRRIVKHKLIKKLVRFGNLEQQIRVKFWCKLSSYQDLEEALAD
jgi:hypothetical protein